MYNITWEDLALIAEEAAHPQDSEEAYRTVFFVMEQLFPPYLYARANTFENEQDLQDCLMTAEIRIIERIQRCYFEREDMEKTPESLQRWLFTVLKNCYYSELRRTSDGRKALQKMIGETSSEMGLTYDGEGHITNLDGVQESASAEDGFDAIFRKEELNSARDRLRWCFAQIFDSRSDLQIVLAWLTVGALVLCRDMKKKDAIARLAECDPTMGEVFLLLKGLLSELDWMPLTEEDWSGLAARLESVTRDGFPFSQLRFGAFTKQTVKEYISKSINKRNEALLKRLAPVFDPADAFSF